MSSLFTEFPGEQTLYEGDCSVVLDRLPENSVHCVLTSPPYYNLRVYRSPSQAGLLGSEPDIESHLDNLVNIFNKVARVLRPDGVLWLNYGDVYDNRQLVGLPWILAQRLKASGWYLRAALPWFKRNAAPESVTNRPHVAHEYVFLLTRIPGGYYFNMDAARIPSGAPLASKAVKKSIWPTEGRYRDYSAGKGDPNPSQCGSVLGRAFRTHDYWKCAFLSAKEAAEAAVLSPAGALTDGEYLYGIECSNTPYNSKGGHYATFTPHLVFPLLAMGCPFSVCGVCGSPFLEEGDACSSCGAVEPPLPGVVLDPFAGSGTTLMVAQKMGMRGIGIEISPCYLEAAQSRLNPPARVFRFLPEG